MMPPDAPPQQGATAMKSQPDMEEESVKLLRAAALLSAEAESMTRQAHRLLRKVDGKTAHFHRRTDAEIAADKKAAKASA
jgi:hypothetical protein